MLVRGDEILVSDAHWPNLSPAIIEAGVYIESFSMLRVHAVGQREPEEAKHGDPGSAELGDVLPLGGKPLHGIRPDAIGLAMKERSPMCRVVLGRHQSASHRVARRREILARRQALLAHPTEVDSEPALADSTFFAEEAEVVGGHAVLVEKASHSGRQGAPEGQV